MPEADGNRSGAGRQGIVQRQRKRRAAASFVSLQARLFPSSNAIKSAHICDVRKLSICAASASWLWSLAAASRPRETFHMLQVVTNKFV